MPHKLLRLISTFCIAFCLSWTMATPSAAQSTAEQYEDAQKMAQWGLSLQAVEDRVLELFDHPNFNFILSSVSGEQETETDILKAKFVEWKAYNEKELTGVREAFNTLPPMPQITPDEDLSKAMTARHEGLITMIDGIEGSLKKTETFFNAAIYENDVDLTGLAIVQVESIQRILKAESLTITQSVSGTDEDHPQTSLSEQSVLTNDFLIAYLDIQILNLHDKGSLTDRKLKMDNIQSTLKSFKKSLKSGQNKRKSYSRRLKLAKTLTSDATGKAELDFATRIIGSYEPSFEVEQKIYEQFKEAHGLLKSDATFNELEVEVEKPMNKFYALIDERLKYNEVRQKIIANGQ